MTKMLESTCRICGERFEYPTRPGRRSTVCAKDECARAGAKDRLKGQSQRPSRLVTTDCANCGFSFTYEHRTQWRTLCDRGPCRQERVNASGRAGQQANREGINQIKANPCMDCKVTFPPECMDFDHRPGEVKLFTIGASTNRSWQQLLEEIAKCDLVCANCHRIRTRKRWELNRYLDSLE